MPVGFSPYNRAHFLRGMANERARNAVKGAFPNVLTSYDNSGTITNNTATMASGVISTMPLQLCANKVYNISGLFVMTGITTGAGNGVQFDMNGGTVAVQNMAGNFFFTAHNTATTLSFDTAALSTTIGGGTVTAWTKVWIDVTLQTTNSGVLLFRVGSTGAGGSAPLIAAGSSLIAMPYDVIIEE